MNLIISTLEKQDFHRLVNFSVNSVQITGWEKLRNTQSHVSVKPLEAS